MSIRKKIQLPMIIMSLVCALVLGLSGIFILHVFVQDFNEQQMETANTLAEEMLSDYKEDCTMSSTLVAEDDSVISILSQGMNEDNRPQLVEISTFLLRTTGVDFLTILDPLGNVLVRAHEPDNYGDSLANQTNIKSAMSGKQYTTIETGTAVKLSVRCGTPILDGENNLVGIVSLGFRLDQNSFVDHVKRMNKTEVTVFLGDTRVSTTLMDETGQRSTGTKADEHIAKHVLAGNVYTGDIKVLGHKLLVSYSPIKDTEGTILGMLFIGLDTSVVDARINRDSLILLIDTIMLALVALFIAIKVSMSISRPIKEMVDVAEQLSLGDVEVQLNVSQDDKSKDETVMLGRAFGRLIRTNKERAAVIRAIASGDMSGQARVRSPKDVVGKALVELLDRNNKVFSEMSDNASQLDKASNQVALGAQNVANGATEQAATIQQLHATLQELSERTINNTKQAENAAELSRDVKEHAEKGSNQMDQMMEAVAQISRASQEIGKVMKAVDDIAFQTNILALNAAVEAARAGQYGKGFAVVAEEVRNLAAKSADAAKETEHLIANSIEKAELGARISEETVSSFVKIVDGVNQCSAIVEDISEFTKMQNRDIETVTVDINSVGNVVNSVSSAAEESAAASEEMSAMATAMARTLSEFKLREQSDRISLTESTF